MKIRNKHPQCLGFPGGSVVKKSACQCRSCRFDPWVRNIPWRRKWQSTPVFLPGKSHGQSSIAGCSPWCCKESDTTEQLNNNILSVHQGLGSVYQVVSGTYIYSPSLLQFGCCSFGLLSTPEEVNVRRWLPLPCPLRGTAGS